MKKIFIISVITSFLIGCIGGCIYTIVNILKEETVITKEIKQEPIQQQITYELLMEEPDPYEIASNNMQSEMEAIESIEDRKEWYLAYKNIIFKYSKWFDPPETIYDCFSEEEIYLMQRCIETEVYQCSFEAKCNIASVILNRLENDEFPNSVSEIIVEKQFAFWRTNISEDTILALEYAFQIEDTTTGALYFEKGTVHESYAQPLFTYSAMHRFYQ